MAMIETVIETRDAAQLEYEDYVTPLFAENRELTEEEEDLLNDNVVVILFERSDGIVEADWFDKKREAEKAWAGIEEEMADIEGEEEDEFLFAFYSYLKASIGFKLAALLAG